MKVTTSFLLALIAILSFIQTIQATHSFSPVDVRFFGNSGQRSFIIAKYIHHSPQYAESSKMDITIKFPGEFPTLKKHYNELKCGALFNMNFPRDAIILPMANNRFTKVSDSDSNTTTLETTLNLTNAMDRNGILNTTNKLLLGNFQIYCTYVSPIYEYKESSVSFTISLDRSTSTILGTGKNRKRKLPITGLGIFISYTYSTTHPTSFAIHGSQSFTKGYEIILRNPPASRSLNITPFEFHEYFPNTHCEIHREGYYSSSDGIGQRYEDGNAIKIIMSIPLNTYSNYEIYCDGIRGIPIDDSYVNRITNLTPSMMELSYEDTHYYYNTAFTTNLPVPTKTVSSTKTVESTFVTAEDVENIDDVQDEIQDILPRPISYYQNRQSTNLDDVSEDVTVTGLVRLSESEATILPTNIEATNIEATSISVDNTNF